MLLLERILAEEIRPALGCTEPAAVALAAAEAAALLPKGHELERLELVLSANVYKNGMFVGVPNTNGLQGTAAAAALGAAGGDTSLDLEVLRSCTKAHLDQARTWLAQDRVVTHCDFQRTGVYIDATATAGNHSGRCCIAGSHTRRVLRQQDGVALVNASADPSSPAELPSLNRLMRSLQFADLLELTASAAPEQLQYMLVGVQMNYEASLAGLALDAAAARSLEPLDSSRLCVGQRLRIHCCAASEARMAGLAVPVMSSFGSGNQGIVATLPFRFLQETYGSSDEDTGRAVLLSHLVSGYLKAHLGKLSAFCGCTISAGAGAAAGAALLLGADLEQIQLAVQTMLSNTAGMICDGAKSNCSFKVGIGVYEAFLTAQLALDNRGVRPPEGIVSCRLEDTVQHLMELNVPCTDRLIISLMEETAGGSAKQAKPFCAGNQSEAQQ